MKISIIIPIYNVEKYLRHCLDSAVNQTEKDIEIICIDDNSTDSSLLIAGQYAKADNRVRIIKHDVNKGTLQARKTGVLKAQGKYVIFLDSDDFLMLDACEKLYQLIEKLAVDMLQFGTHLIPGDNISPELFAWVENYLKPYDGKIERSGILEACFVDNQFDSNITDKIWNTSVCKKAFDFLSNEHMTAAEDQYAFFIMSYFAKSYFGIPGKVYYNYNLGIGITGGDTLDLVRFTKRCTGRLAVEKVKEFLISQKVFEAMSEVYQSFANKILWDCVDCWYNKLDVKDSNEGYDILLKYWNPGEVVGTCGKFYFDRQEELWQRANKAKALQCCQYNLKAGVYYHCLSDRKIRKAIKNQLFRLQTLGYEPVVLTDMDDSYSAALCAGVEVHRIPSIVQSYQNQYVVRSNALYHIMQSLELSLVVYMSPASAVMLLDELLIRSAGATVITVFDEQYLKKDNSILKKGYSLVKERAKQVRNWIVGNGGK